MSLQPNHVQEIKKLSSANKPKKQKGDVEMLKVKPFGLTLVFPHDCKDLWTDTAAILSHIHSRTVFFYEDNRVCFTL